MKNFKFLMTALSIITLFLGFNTTSNAQNWTLSGSNLTTNYNVGINSSPSTGFRLTVGGHINVGGNNPSQLRTRFINGKESYSSALDHLYLNFNTGKDVYVGAQNPNKPASDLRVSGNIIVGFPTTPTGYRLYVKDGILTEKVKVATVGTADWADYVFDENYHLNSTKDVEEFIEANQHLPNVPSAKEVNENGFDLAKMDATLLRQIEELWLHVIELNKEKENLQNGLTKDIENLQNELNALYKKMEVVENKQ